MSILKWQTEEKFLANLMLLSSGAWLAVSGYYFVADSYKSEALTYELMTNLMPLDAWGVLMAIAGILLILATFQMGRTRYSLMMVGGVISAFVVMLYAMAAAQGADSYLGPLRYSLGACCNLLIAVWGGIEAWRIRKSTLRTSN